MIYKEPLVAVIPSIHPLTEDAPCPISIKAIAHEPIIIIPYKRGPVLYDYIITSCQEAGFSLEFLQEQLSKITHSLPDSLISALRASVINQQHNK